ncbi:hypothetical protein JOB18_011352 [Solea senegalensis]|uniref:Uncharacterized protein n=1 Tax=Solea senegalensis TaxID=28829 RepID=A0AAV6QAD9_SOLSE|nr:hypothetical protein JOB18_011352 [Solea senegalensis]
MLMLIALNCHCCSLHPPQGQGSDQKAEPTRPRVESLRTRGQDYSPAAAGHL